MSWNGATEVAEWRLLAGPSPGSLRVIGTHTANAFETVVEGGIKPADTVFAAEALDVHASVLRRSPVVAAQPGSQGADWVGLGGLTPSRVASTEKSMFGPRLIGALGQDGALWVQDPSNGVWQSEGGLSKYAPTVARAATGPTWLLGTGLNNQLYVRRARDVRSSWGPIGGILTSSPAAASARPGHVDVVARGADNALWHLSVDGNVWTDWERVGGVLLGGAGISANEAGRLDVVAVGTDQAVWHTYRDERTGNWSAWERVGGIALDQPSIVALPGGQFAIYATGADRAVWKTIWNGAWSGWTRLGGITDTGPTAVARPDGLADIYATGTNGSAYVAVG